MGADGFFSHAVSRAEWGERKLDMGDAKASWYGANPPASPYSISVRTG